MLTDAALAVSWINEMAEIQVCNAGRDWQSASKLGKMEAYPPLEPLPVGE